MLRYLNSHEDSSILNWVPQSRMMGSKARCVSNARQVLSTGMEGPNPGDVASAGFEKWRGRSTAHGQSPLADLKNERSDHARSEDFRAALNTFGTHQLKLTRTDKPNHGTKPHPIKAGPINERTDCGDATRLSRHVLGDRISKSIGATYRMEQFCIVPSWHFGGVPSENRKKNPLRFLVFSTIYLFE